MGKSWQLASSDVKRALTARQTIGESDIKLVAIEHTVATDQVASIGTRIGHVLGLIRSFDPGLERAINLQWPIKVPHQPGRMVIERKG